MVSQASRPVALITGGTSGIGLATAQLLAKDFAVVVTGHNPETLSAAARELPDDVLVLAADARSLADMDAVATELRDRFGRLDLLFLNAGIGKMVPFEAVDESFYDDHFDVNVKGHFFLLQKVSPLLVEGGSVVMSGALGVSRALPNWAVYSATKGAMLSFMRAMSLELAPRKIRVNAISAGPIETPALAKLGLTEDDLDGWRANMGQRIPLGRVGSADDVAQVVAFLASPAAAFITGADIPVDGGLRVG